jgi:predicted lysophospholipase L1 biosynthesis ABC-type transport system permease subunit
MKSIFVALSIVLLGFTAITLWTQRHRLNWEVFLAGVTFAIGCFYAMAEPLIPGKTYLVGQNGPVEVPSIPLVQVI